MVIDIPAWMMMVLYFGTMVVLSVFETVGTPLTMDEYGLTPQKVHDVSAAKLSRLISLTVSLVGASVFYASLYLLSSRNWCVPDLHRCLT